MSFAPIDVHHDMVVRTAAIKAREESQPCPVCFADVHPSNWDRHMQMYHPDADLPFDYASLTIEDRITLRQRAVEIKAIMRQTVQGILDIGEKLTEGKARLPHKYFLKWVKLEFGWTPRAAQRFMTAYDAFKHDKLDAFHIGSSALYLLSAPSTPEGARREAIALMEGGERLTIEATKAIIAEHKPTPAVREMIEEKGITDPLAVQLFNRIEGTESFDELNTTDHLQPTGNETDTVHVTDPAVDIQAALYDKTREYKIIGAQASGKPYTPPAEIEPTTPTYLFETERTANGLFYVTVRYGMFTNAADANAALIQLQKRIEKGCTK